MKDQFSDLCGQWQKCHFFSGFEPHSWGVKIGAENEECFGSVSTKTSPLLQKAGVHLEIENKQRLPQEKKHII